MNICGCLVHVAPDQAQTARSAIDATDGAEVHAADDDGRFVVVVEDTAQQRASEIIMDMHQIPGVISLTLNYHHFEDARAASTRQPLAGGQTHDRF